MASSESAKRKESNMQFVVSKQNLQKELGFVQGVVEKKNTIPVLSNILIESVGENSIRFLILTTAGRMPHATTPRRNDDLSACVAPSRRCGRKLNI